MAQVLNIPVLNKVFKKNAASWMLDMILNIPQFLNMMWF